MSDYYSPESQASSTTLEVLEVQEAARNAQQLDPFRRVGLENALAAVEAGHVYRKLDGFIAQQAGALGLTFADIDTTPTFLP